LICFRIFDENSEITGITSNEGDNEEVARSVEIFDILDNAIIDNLDRLLLRCPLKMTQLYSNYE